MAAAGPDFLRFEISVSAICAIAWWVIEVGGRGGKTTGRPSEGSCYGRRWRRSSIWAIRWCGWRERSIGGFSTGRFAGVCTPGPGQPGLPIRLVAGLFILKHMHNLSDEALCARWLENPYYQFFVTVR